jgi:hypothetical protein
VFFLVPEQLSPSSSFRALVPEFLLPIASKRSLPLMFFAQTD